MNFRSLIHDIYDLIRFPLRIMGSLAGFTATLLLGMLAFSGV